jgi:choline dehydrogenase
MQYSINEGIRHSTASAYLEDVADHPDLRVLLHAQARRLLFAGTRRIGVEWSRDGP